MRSFVAVAVALVLSSGAVEVRGEARASGLSRDSGSPSDSGLSSDNVEYVTTVPTEVGTASGARLVGKYLYVAGAKSFSIYDVSDPEAPVLESLTPTGPNFPNEDVDTNGKVLLLTDNTQSSELHVWDVEDKGSPELLVTFENLRDHTFSCMLGCRYAYGSRGTIVDLRRPAEAKIVGNWNPGLQQGDGFDVTEARRGMAVTSTRVLQLLDGRKDPTRPVLRAIGTTGDNRLLHSNRWPREGRDRFLLVQGETTIKPRCDENSGAFMTWETRGWRKTHRFEMIDEYRVSNGLLVDGNPPANVVGCTNMWFQEHPTFSDGGLVAAAFFDHGTRFLNVDRRGQISEVGYFTPVGGQTISALWVTKDIAYAIDLTRGIDILRFSHR
ncbi:MAG TPA: hypothetical protein VFS18_02640 [Actinomycetota bacterium]|nr:hypothetical protein [Actinomycetota bacterium]